jgi:hypothetical protein
MGGKGLSGSEEPYRYHGKKLVFVIFETKFARRTKQEANGH